MPGQSNRDGQLENRVADQVGRIVAAFHAVDVNIGVVPAKGGKVEYMYAEDQLLVQDSYTNAVYEFLNPGLRFDSSRVDRIIPGVTRLFLPAPAPGQERR